VAVVHDLQTKITYNNNSQHQQYIEQTIYPPLGAGKSADHAQVFERNTLAFALQPREGTENLGQGSSPC